MPELVARSIFPRLQRELDVPILSLIFDEQTGKAGLLTRIEAFIDLLWVRRKRGLLPRKDKITWFPGGSYQPQLFGFKRR
jgi:predicted nucleotide-binding protein (sugar kinase/HSP70/actin superfamily)